MGLALEERNRTGILAAVNPMPIDATTRGSILSESLPEGRENCHDERLKHQDYTCLLGSETFDVLEIEAHEKGRTAKVAL